jgi:ribosomal protein S8E
MKQTVHNLLDMVRAGKPGAILQVNSHPRTLTPFLSQAQGFVTSPSDEGFPGKAVAVISTMPEQSGRMNFFLRI